MKSALASRSNASAMILPPAAAAALVARVAAMRIEKILNLYRIDAVMASSSRLVLAVIVVHQRAHVRHEVHRVELQSVKARAQPPGLIDDVRNHPVHLRTGANEGELKSVSLRYALRGIRRRGVGAIQERPVAPIQAVGFCIC